MTDQISHQMPGRALPPGPLTGQPPSPVADLRRCKQPGCGTELPAAAGRGAPRLFCGPLSGNIGRVSLFGGSLDAHPTADGGFFLTATMPIPEAE